MKNQTKTKIALVLSIFFLALAISGVLALTTLSFHQNPIVPSGQTNFSITPSIVAGSDQTSLWTWIPASNSFIASITLTNNNNVAWTPQITDSNTPTDWTFSTSALTAVAPGGQLVVTLTLHYTGSGSPAAGAIGDSTININ